MGQLTGRLPVPSSPGRFRSQSRGGQRCGGQLSPAPYPALRGADRVTLKTLENFVYLGLLVTLFPRARVIYCRRDPRDVCLSCYFHNFQGMDYSWSLEDIAVTIGSTSAHGPLGRRPAAYDPRSPV